VCLLRVSPLKSVFCACKSIEVCPVKYCKSDKADRMSPRDYRANDHDCRDNDLDERVYEIK
jgi:hypothetical protein